MEITKIKVTLQPRLMVVKEHHTYNAYDNIDESYTEILWQTSKGKTNKRHHQITLGVN